MKNVLANVVMLPHNEGVILQNKTSKAIAVAYWGHHPDWWGNHNHLSFTTDEEIKSGDPYYIPSEKAISICKEVKNGWIISQDYPHYTRLSSEVVKIVASTDESLGLPRPSNEFLKAYCEKGGIDQVLIEYESVGPGFHAWYDVKIAPDNTITIHPVKEKTYTRDEVIEFCKKAFKAQYGSGIYGFENWIKNNL